MAYTIEKKDINNKGMTTYHLKTKKNIKCLSNLSMKDIQIKTVSLK